MLTAQAPLLPPHAQPERSLLARLRSDERMAERRRLGVRDLGATWLRPP